MNKRERSFETNFGTCVVCECFDFELGSCLDCHPNSYNEKFKMILTKNY